MRRFQDFENLGFGHEMGRRGSEWAHTFGKWGLEMNNGGWRKIELGVNGLGSNSYGLILWENDATGLGIIF